MKLPTILPSLSLLLSVTTTLSPPTNAQTQPPLFPNLHFALLECDTTRTTTNPTTNNTRLNFNLVALSAAGPPRPITSSNPLVYSIPQNGLPYTRYEGFTSTAFFFSEPGHIKTLPRFPRGFLTLKIPAEAKGTKIGVQAGTVEFEGVEFYCAREQGSTFTAGFVGCGGEGEAGKGDRFCSESTFCQSRYVCRRERWPVENKACGGGPGCWPSWDLPGN